MEKIVDDILVPVNGLFNASVAREEQTTECSVLRDAHFVHQDTQVLLIHLRFKRG